METNNEHAGEIRDRDTRKGKLEREAEQRFENAKSEAAPVKDKALIYKLHRDVYMTQLQVEATISAFTNKGTEYMSLKRGRDDLE